MLVDGEWWSGSPGKLGSEADTTASSIAVEILIPLGITNV